MPTDIQVKVKNKVASVIDTPLIICGNSDYRVIFTFDTEWETLVFKTARFVYKKAGQLQYVDVVFTGDEVVVPILTNIEEVYLGVYAGELHTTTPARIPCQKSILCGTSAPHEEPDPDLYNDILAAINNLETLPDVSERDDGKALMVNENGHWVVRQPDFIRELNENRRFRPFIGTLDEFNDWEGDKTDILFIPTDDTGMDVVRDLIAEALENYINSPGALVIGDFILSRKRLLPCVLKESQKDDIIVDWSESVAFEQNTGKRLEFNENISGKTIEVYTNCGVFKFKVVPDEVCFNMAITVGQGSARLVDGFLDIVGEVSIFYDVDNYLAIEYVHLPLNTYGDRVITVQKIYEVIE